MEPSLLLTVMFHLNLVMGPGFTRFINTLSNLWQSDDLVQILDFMSPGLQIGILYVKKKTKNRTFHFCLYLLFRNFYLFKKTRTLSALLTLFSNKLVAILCEHPAGALPDKSIDNFLPDLPDNSHTSVKSEPGTEIKEVTHEKDQTESAATSSAAPESAVPQPPRAAPEVEEQDHRTVIEALKGLEDKIKKQTVTPLYTLAIFVDLTEGFDTSFTRLRNTYCDSAGGSLGVRWMDVKEGYVEADVIYTMKKLIEEITEDLKVVLFVNSMHATKEGALRCKPSPTGPIPLSGRRNLFTWKGILQAPGEVKNVKEILVFTDGCESAQNNLTFRPDQFVLFMGHHSKVKKMQTASGNIESPIWIFLRNLRFTATIKHLIAKLYVEFTEVKLTLFSVEVSCVSGAVPGIKWHGKSSSKYALLTLECIGKKRASDAPSLPGTRNLCMYLSLLNFPIF